MVKEPVFTMETREGVVRYVQVRQKHTNREDNIFQHMMKVARGCEVRQLTLSEGGHTNAVVIDHPFVKTRG